MKPPTDNEKNALRKSLYPERYPDYSVFFPNGTRDSMMTTHHGKLDPSYAAAESNITVQRTALIESGRPLCVQAI